MLKTQTLVVLATLLIGGVSTVQAEERGRYLPALDNAKFTLTQAIEAAERAGQGKAVEAEFDAKRGDAYEVKILSQDKLIEYTLDANSGQITKAGNERLEKFFIRLTPQDVANAKTTLVQAIVAAEQHAGGKAAEAEVEREGDSVRYKVTVIAAGKTQKVKIDAASGAVRSVEQEWH